MTSATSHPPTGCKHEGLPNGGDGSPEDCPAPS